MKERKNSLREELGELFFPRRCCFCWRLSGRDRRVCKSCAARYPDLKGPLSYQRIEGRLDCYSPLRYEGAARNALLRFKFREQWDYAPVFGNFMRKCLDENGISCDSITWVPLSARRLRARGYDQARLLAEEIAREWGLPCEALLEKTKHTRPQSGLKSREARRSNAEGVYRAPDPDRIAGREILLVDDIVTTGATLLSCCKVLKAAGAKRVTAVTAARRIE